MISKKTKDRRENKKSLKEEKAGLKKNKKKKGKKVYDKFCLQKIFCSMQL